MGASPPHPIPTYDQMNEDDMGKTGMTRVTHRLCDIPIRKKTHGNLSVD
jgi:hypothetical protein